MSTTNDSTSSDANIVGTTIASSTVTTDSVNATTTTTSPPQQQKSKTPSDFLKSILGRPIRVKLNSGIEYRGILGSLDGYLNIAMEQTEEYSTTGQLQAKYGDCFIRGNNVMYITTPPQR